MTKLRSFMSLANYYRKFIKGFSNIAAPLNKHLNGSCKNGLLSEDAKEAFEKLKQELSNVDNVLSTTQFRFTIHLRDRCQ